MRRFSIISSLFVLLTGTALGAQVGDYGAPEKLVFEGCKAFPAAELRSALLADWEVQLASLPSNDLHDYVATLRRQLTFGYMQQGFPKAQVSAEADAGRGVVVITVVEGPRYVCGPVHFHGNHQIPVDRIVESLTQPRSEDRFKSERSPTEGARKLGMVISKVRSKAKWEKGHAAPLDPSSEVDVTSRVRSAFESFGYFATQFDLTMPTADGAASLEINIADEGPHAVLGDVTIKGLQKNSEASLLALLGWKKGAPLPDYAPEAAQRKLWHTGRFKKHLIEVVPSEDKSKLHVNLDLEEYVNAPALEAPLTPAEQTLLKCREWILSRRAAGEDLHFKVVSIDALAAGVKEQANLAIGRDGFGLRARRYELATATKLPSLKADSPEYFLGLTRTRLGLFDLSSGRKLVAPLGKSIGIDLNFDLCAKVDEKGNGTWNAGLGGGLNTGSTGLNLQLNLGPVAFLDLAHRPDMHYEARENILLVTGPNTRCKIDAATGQLHECKFAFGELLIEFSVGAGEVSAEFDAVEKAVNGGNLYEPQRPVGSTLSFVANEAIRSPFLKPYLGSLPNEVAQQSIGHLLSPGVFDCAQHAFNAINRGDQEFSIPLDAGDPGSSSLATAMLSFGLPVADVSFTRGSWPWVLVRQKILISAGQTKTFTPELNRVFALQQVGPVGGWAIADFLKPYSAADASQIASAFLQSTPDDFQKDIDALTRGGGIGPRMLQNAAEALRRLPQPELDALADSLSPDSAKLFRRFADSLRADPDQPIEQALSAAMAGAWKNGMREKIVDGLRSFVQRN